MTAPTKPHVSDAAAPENSEPDEDVLSPEDQEELEFFRAVAIHAREATARELQRLIQPDE